MKITRWLPLILAAFLLSSAVLAAGLSYDNPPDPIQRGENRDRPAQNGDNLGVKKGATITDATGNTATSTWSTWQSASDRKEDALEFDTGAQDNTREPPKMLSGRLDWNNDSWSDCKASAAGAYCGTTVSGLRERSVWCGIKRIDTGSGKVEDNNCLVLDRSRPDDTKSCTKKVTMDWSDCVYPPVVVTLEPSPERTFLANNRDTVTLTATLKRTTGEIAAGETVNWSTSRGTLSTKKNQSDSKGRASVTLRSSSIGSAKITAKSNDSSKSTTVDFVTPVPSLVTLTANPSSGISADNSERSTIVATLRYANGQNASGQEITFATNRGTLSAATRTTNSAGQASVTLRSSSAGTAKVTARSDESSRSTNVRFTGPKLTALTASPTKGLIANNSDSSSIVATVKYDNGKLVKNEVVEFSTTLGSLSASTAKTNDKGQASLKLKSNRQGTAKVTASVDDSERTVSVTFDPVPVPKVVGISASPSSGLTANGSDRSKVIATVEMSDGGSASGKRVSFSTSRGSLSASSATTNSSGKATVYLTSTSAGSAKVVASIDGTSKSTTVSFESVPVPSVSSISASPASGITANGSDRSAITAKVQMSDGSSAAGERVSFSTNKGKLSASSATADSSGNAVVNLTSTDAGTATVTASINGTSKSVNVGFVTPPPSSEERQLDIAYGQGVQDCNSNRPYAYVYSGVGTTNRLKEISESEFSNGRFIHDGATYEFNSGSPVATRQVACLGGLGRPVPYTIGTFDFTITP